MSKEQDKIQTYQTALSQIIKDLTARRTEMAMLAKKTLADFEAKIPELSAQATQLAKTIVELETVLVEKKRLAEVEQTNFQELYEKKAESLKEEYDEKDLRLQEREKALGIKETRYQELIRQDKQELKNREDSLASGQVILAKDKEQLASNETILNNKIREHANVVTTFKNEQGQERLTLSAQKEDVLIRRKAVEQKEKDFIAKDKKAEEAIARLNDMEFRENALSIRENVLRKEKESLHGIAVKNMAENTKLNRRQADLEIFESSLTERENNIKLAEANLVK